MAASGDKDIKGSNDCLASVASFLEGCFESGKERPEPLDRVVVPECLELGTWVNATSAVR